jgi:hypothetical protein
MREKIDVDDRNAEQRYGAHEVRKRLTCGVHDEAEA